MNPKPILLAPTVIALALLCACQQPQQADGSVMEGVEQAEAAKRDPAANLKAAEEFIATKRAEPGVVETASGLLYKVEKSGPASGPQPTEASMVRVHYEGTLPDGTVFDSSYARGEPAEFPAGRLIPAWVEALQLMRPGDQWMIYVKPELGYGEMGAGPDIPPNAALVFKMELIEVLSNPKAG
jgi:FKBP-type peptidyl-prolyl cis-trans isomerase FklB